MIDYTQFLYKFGNTKVLFFSFVTIYKKYEDRAVRLKTTPGSYKNNAGVV